MEKKETQRDIESTQFSRVLYPIKKIILPEYELVDYQGQLEWKDRRFYLFWGDQEIKKIIDRNPEWVTNWVLSKGNFCYVSLKKEIGGRKRMTLYNLENLFAYDFDSEYVSNHFKTDSAKTIFEVMRAILYDLGVDLAFVKTKPQAASTLYRWGFLQRPILSSVYTLRRMALKCAYGDLRQVYRTGDFRGIFRLYDVKSFYPQNILSLRKLPSGEDWFYCSTVEEFLDQRNLGGIARVYFKARTGYNFLGRKGKDGLKYMNEGYICLTLTEYKALSEQADFYYFAGGYAYRKGDCSLYDYESFLLELREKHKADPVLNFYLKSLGNLIVGKFLQKGSRLSPDYVREICSKYGIPFSMALQTKVERIEERYIHRIGAAFCPEWYSLITGQGRSIEAQAIMQTNPFIAQSDSVVTEKNLGKEFLIGAYKYRVKREAPRLIVLGTGQFIIDGEKPYVSASGFHAQSYEGLKEIFLNKLKKRLDNSKGKC